MKASHNSATGEKPLNLWARLFPFIAKCQDKTIREQYEAGVRLFDIRVRWNDSRELVCCHGLATYQMTLRDVCLDLRMSPNVWVMVTYEGYLDEIEEEAFINTVHDECEDAGVNCGHISVKLPVWNVISPAPRQPACAQNYVKIVGWKVLLPFPRLWDKWLKAKGKGQNESDEILSMEDFV